jgi:hypothetical protein
MKTIRINDCYADSAPQLAEFLFKDDRPFVPLTALASLPRSADSNDFEDREFYSATVDYGPMTAMTSWERWITGCDTPISDSRYDVSVYELATSKVSSLGGFDKYTQKPGQMTMHQVLTALRLVSIVLGAIGEPDDDPEGKERVCLITRIAAKNSDSYNNMKELGFSEIEQLPRWLEYEHRTWFTNLNPDKNRPPRTQKDIAAEARYLWLDHAGLVQTLRRLAPLAQGRDTLVRTNDTTGKDEHFGILVNIHSITSGIAQFGSYTALAEFIAAGEGVRLVEAPTHIRLPRGIF